MQVVFRIYSCCRYEEVRLDEDASSGDGSEQLYARFDPTTATYRCGQAPLLRAYIAYDRAKGTAGC